MVNLLTNNQDTDMKRLDTFTQFWPFYLKQHANRTNRYLHLFGLSMALVVCVVALGLERYGLLWCLPVCGYGFAWIGHYFVERNVPATFTYPVWSFMADLKMCYLIVIGKMDQELKIVKES